MDKDGKITNRLTKKGRPKKRRLGLSKRRFVEVVPRAVADAEIAKDFEDSKLFPDEKE